MEMKKAFIFLGGLIAGVVIKNKCEEYIKNEIEDVIEHNKNSLLIDGIVFESKEEVEEVLESLDEMIEEFGMASELDLYDLIGIEEPLASNKYGWTDIRNTTITQVKDRYIVKLPKVVSLY